MSNSSQKEQVLKRLSRHYISPLTQFSIELELLKRIMLGRPSRAQIATPDSWRMLPYLDKTKGMAQADAFARLEVFERYLETPNLSVFAHDKPLILGESFPYFEWVNHQKVKGLNHLLGQARLFYLYKGNEDLAYQFYDLTEKNLLMPYLVMIGELPEKLLEVTRARGICHIDALSRPFLENMTKSRGLTNLFNQSADILLMDQWGRYVKGLSRPEFSKQIEGLIETYFRG